MLDLPDTYSRDYFSYLWILKVTWCLGDPGISWLPFLIRLAFDKRDAFIYAFVRIYIHEVIERSIWIVYN